MREDTMNANMKRTMLALAVATLFGTSMAYANDHDRGRDSHHVYKSVTYKYEKDVTKNTDINKNVNVNKNIDVRKEKNAHSVDVAFKKSLGLSTDVNISGDPTVSGDIQVDSAAIAVIDNRQSVSGNFSSNDKLSNTSSIRDNVGSNATGNIGMNVAAGDNNAQDNAAALSAADASFSFGMADAEVFVNQNGSGNLTINKGVTNAAGIGDNAFNTATGNIGVNVTSGNNNEQKNALAASVATTDYAQSSISSNQISSGNAVSNAGKTERYADTTSVNLHGSVRGYSLGVGVGGYSGSSTGTYSGDTSSTSTGNAYQMTNFYPDMWTNASTDDPAQVHPGNNLFGHADFDTQTQGAVQNPNRDGVGGLGFDTAGSSTGSESGTTSSEESGQLGFVELSASDLYANLSGTVQTWRYVAINASNDASLSSNAFQNASGNIGVNVASGSGNLQANSLALAVAQPSTGTPPPGGGGE
jgi:hypothetical protein